MFSHSKNTLLPFSVRSLLLVTCLNYSYTSFRSLLLVTCLNYSYTSFRSLLLETCLNYSYTSFRSLLLVTCLNNSYTSFVYTYFHTWLPAWCLRRLGDYYLINWILNGTQSSQSGMILEAFGTFSKVVVFWFWYSKFSIFGWWHSPFYLLRGLYFSTYSVC